MAAQSYHLAMNKPMPLLADVLNLAQFAQKSGLPLRTLQRIKAEGPEYPMSPTTRLALEAAFKRCKPALKEKQ